MHLFSDSFTGSSPTDAYGVLADHTRFLCSAICSKFDCDWPVHYLRLSLTELRGLLPQGLPSQFLVIWFWQCIMPHSVNEAHTGRHGQTTVDCDAWNWHCYILLFGATIHLLHDVMIWRMLIGLRHKASSCSTCLQCLGVVSLDLSSSVWHSHSLKQYWNWCPFFTVWDLC